MIVEAFGGPGGWAEALRMLGVDGAIGIEIDAAAVATRRAAGHRTDHADVRTWKLPPSCDGFLGSPPCPSYSTAGKGAGRLVIGIVQDAIRDAFAGRPTIARRTRDAARAIRADLLARTKMTRAAASAHAWNEARGAMLSVQPARYIAHLNPTWVALEQVVPALPLWRLYAELLRERGFSTWAGVLNAADFGVPQTRRRAFLIANRERAVTAPAPTHTEGGGSTLFGDLAPWVSMAEALSPLWPEHPARTLCGDRSPRWLYPDHDGTHGVVLSGSRMDNAAQRTPAQPAPTVLASWAKCGNGEWVVDRRTRSKGPRGTIVPTTTVSTSRPSPTLTSKAGGQWTLTRPATTVQGSDRVWPPGHKVNRDDIARLGEAEAFARYGDRAGTEAIKLTIAEALVLQSFRPDYPVQGNKPEQFRQVGDAVPPLLGAHVVAAAIGLEAPTP